MDHGAVVPLPRRSPERSGRVVVVAVESIPLSPEQEAAAVRALATLISRWMAQRATPDTTTDRQARTRAA